LNRHDAAVSILASRSPFYVMLGLDPSICRGKSA
jgi:hypothetical protein